MSCKLDDSAGDPHANGIFPDGVGDNEHLLSFVRFILSVAVLFTGQQIMTYTVTYFPL